MTGGARVSEIFGINVFSDAQMRARFPKPVYQALRKTKEEGVPLDFSIADIVASVMSQWAIES